MKSYGSGSNKWLNLLMAEQDSSTGGPLELSDSNFNQALKDNSFIVVDFWAPWCGPCRALAPHIDAMVGKYAGEVVFAKMNVDKNSLMPGKFGIMTIPTLLFFKNGELVDKVSGAVPELIENTIAKHI